MRRNSWSALIAGMAIGAGIGAALGILFAPQSGEDTRDYLLETAKDRIHQTKDRLNDVGDRLRDVKDRVTGVVESGKEFARQAQDSVDQVKGHIQELGDAGRRAYREAKKA
jgi:gas vesicle protein